MIKSRRLRWASQVVRMEDSRSAFKTLKIKPTIKRSLGRPMSTMVLKEIGINTRICVDSAPDRDYWRILVNAALNLRVQ